MVSALLSLVVGALPVQALYGQHNANTVQDQEAETAAAVLLDLFGKANDTVYRILTTVEARRNETLPDAVWEEYYEGLEKAAEAEGLMDVGNYTEAKAKVLEAMHILKSVALAVAKEFNDIEWEDERRARIAEGVEAAVERIQARVEKLDEIAEKAEARGMNVSRIRERLGNVTELLERARERIREGYLSEASEKANMSRQWFGHAMAALTPVIHAYKSKQAEKFLNITEECLNAMFGVLNNTIDKMPIPVSVKNLARRNMQHSMETARSRIAEARRRLEEGNITDTMPKLGELKGILPSLIEKVRIGLAQHKPSVDRALQNICRYRIVLRHLEERAEALKEEGVDTSELEAKIQQARDLISSIAAKLQNGEDLESLLGQIGNLIEEVGNLVEQLEVEAESP